jgi:hypothetical protein
LKLVPRNNHLKDATEVLAKKKRHNKSTTTIAMRTRTVATNS